MLCCWVGGSFQLLSSFTTVETPSSLDTRQLNRNAHCALGLSSLPFSSPGEDCSVLHQQHDGGFICFTDPDAICSALRRRFKRTVNVQFAGAKFASLTPESAESFRAFVDRVSRAARDPYQTTDRLLQTDSSTIPLWPIKLRGTMSTVQSQPCHDAGSCRRQC